MTADLVGQLTAPGNNRESQQNRHIGKGTMAYFIVFPNLTDKITEGLVHIDALFGRSLDEAATKVLSELAPLYRKWISRCGSGGGARERVGYRGSLLVARIQGHIYWQPQ
jgi:hypothetical protein